MAYVKDMVIEDSEGNKTKQNKKKINTTMQQ